MEALKANFWSARAESRAEPGAAGTTASAAAKYAVAARRRARRIGTGRRLRLCRRIG